MTDTPDIAEQLRALLPRAHAPYSKVRVAAAVEGGTGALHFGVNVAAFEPCIADTRIVKSASDDIHGLGAVGGEHGGTWGRPVLLRQQGGRRFAGQRGVKPDHAGGRQFFERRW